MILARAPSNIALVKYMGKSDPSQNLPDNPSLSMTLSELATWVSLSAQGSQISLEPGVPQGAPLTARAPDLSVAGRDKVLKHVQFVLQEAERILTKHHLDYSAPRGLLLRTANTFPAASGIASSASSFAAITLAVAAACVRSPQGDPLSRESAAAQTFARAWTQSPELRRALAAVSRRGSGSSCRSMEGPWVRWDGAAAASVPGPQALAHFVILVSSDAKTVSSSEAHSRVKTSPLWQGRAGRAQKRCDDLTHALAQGDFATTAQLAWADAWEMHSLFHTAAEPFTYWKPGTLDALEFLKTDASTGQIIVTLDAGPNVHVTVPDSKASLWRERLKTRFASVLEDRPGPGASIVATGTAAHTQPGAPSRGATA